jgi:hypothetical protein
VARGDQFPGGLVANNAGGGSFQVNCPGAPSVIITSGGSEDAGVGARKTAVGNGLRKQRRQNFAGKMRS